MAQLLNRFGKEICQTKATLELLKPYSDDPAVKSAITGLRQDCGKNRFIAEFYGCALDKQFAIIVNLIAKKGWYDIKNFKYDHIPIICSNCRNTEFQTNKAWRRICLNCSVEVRTLMTCFGYGKPSSYSRLHHFQEMIKQFQGIQNCKIPEILYKDLERKFNYYNIPITKQHIRLFLHKLKQTKHYKMLL